LTGPTPAARQVTQIKPGDRTVVIGRGQPASAAYLLAKEGHAVTVLEVTIWWGDFPHRAVQGLPLRYRWSPLLYQDRAGRSAVA
jgi:hypothetical protein